MMNNMHCNFQFRFVCIVLATFDYLSISYISVLYRQATFYLFGHLLSNQIEFLHLRNQLS